MALSLFLEAPWESSDYSGEPKGLNWSFVESLARANEIAWTGHLTRRLRIMEHRKLVIERDRARLRDAANAYNREHGFS